MSEQRTVGTAILEMMAAQGVDTVFGLPGVHNLAFWSAEPDSGASVRIVGVRHEQACVYAADGYARATGLMSSSSAAVSWVPRLPSTLPRRV